MTLETKVNSEITIKLSITGEVVYGSVTIKQKYKHNKHVTEFVWNTGCDAYPILKNQPYNKEYVQQLKTMIQYYMK